MKQNKSLVVSATAVVGGSMAQRSSFLVTFAIASALSAAANADVLYSSNSGTPNYFTFNGTDPADLITGGQGNGYGDDYNFGYKYANLTGFSFYGGDTDPYQATAANPNVVTQYYVNLVFYKSDGTKNFSVQLPDSSIYGIGYHTISTADLMVNGTSPTMTSGGYFTFQPFYEAVTNVNTNSSTGVPSTRPQFTFGYGSTPPTTGANNPTYSAQTYPTVVNGINVAMLSTGAYASGGNATAQYGMFEIDGTGFNINSTTPLWSAVGSGDWATASNWTYGVPDAIDSTANFDEGITANSTVTLSSAQTVGTVNFDNPLFKFTVVGTSTLTLSASSGPASINSWSGSHSITAPIVYTAGLTVTTFTDPAPGSPSLTLPLNITATGTMVKSGTGTLKFAASASGISTLNLDGLTINAGTVVLASNTSNAVRTLLITSALSITGGSLDLGNNDLDITGVASAGLAAINRYVATGYNGGTWNGSGGITSSVAASNTRHLTALGVILNSVNGTASGTALYGSSTSLGLFDGTSPSSTDVLAKYTYYGDANLDGKVDGSDYSKIDNGYLTHITGWFNGDFNYDGVINGSDYTLIDNAFNTQGARLSDQIASPNAFSTGQIAVAAGISSVPEPASVGLTGCIFSGLLARRRRRSDVAAA